MLEDHVNEHDIEHGDLEGKIKIRHADEQRNEERNDSRIEREHIGVFHQGKALGTEFRTKPFGSFPAEIIADNVHHLLELRRPLFLSFGVADIEGLEKLVDEVAAPAHRLVMFLQLG